jgi:hypothetical protein
MKYEDSEGIYVDNKTMTIMELATQSYTKNIFPLTIPSTKWILKKSWFCSGGRNIRG